MSFFTPAKRDFASGHIFKVLSRRDMNYLKARGVFIQLLSFRRKPESSHFNSFWTPATGSSPAHAPPE
jgi:hypothetical protein